MSDGLTGVSHGYGVPQWERSSALGNRQPSCAKWCQYRKHAQYGDAEDTFAVVASRYRAKEMQLTFAI